MTELAPTIAPAPGLRPGGRLRALVVKDQKTLFDIIDVPGVEVQRAYDPERPPHIVVVPCHRQDAAYLQSELTFPDSVWRGAAVAFDSSAEGHVRAESVRRIHAFIAERGLDEGQCAYIIQDRRLSWPGSRVRILHYDYWIRRLFHWSEEAGAAEFEGRLELFRARARRRPRRFVSLNLTARRSKLLFLLSLIRDGLWDQGFVSFGGFQHLQRAQGRSLDGVRHELLKTPGFQDLAAELVPFLPELDAKGQVLFGWISWRQGNYPRKATEGAYLKEYDGSWFSAATETEMSANVDRVTEKLFKALIGFHPQVVLGNARSLKLLKDFGFESFAGAIDEAYDEEPDPRRRFDMAYGEIRRLCRIDEAELERQEQELADVLTANAKWGLIGLPRQYRQERDPAIVSALAALAPAAG